MTEEENIKCRDCARNWYHNLSEEQKNKKRNMEEKGIIH